MNKLLFGAFSFLLLFMVIFLISSQSYMPTRSQNQATGKTTTNGITLSGRPVNSKAVKFDHILIIMMENKSPSEVIGNVNAPYINSLIASYSLLSNYYAVAHPSLPNYLALIGGSTFNVSSDCTDCFVPAPNLVDNLEGGGYSWRAYMESMAQPCTLDSYSLYAVWHNPFIYFDDIRMNRTRCKNIVPYSQFSNDIASTSTAPDFMWISPNLCNDMHDCSVSEGDKWLSEQVPIILQSTIFKSQNSLLFIVWDENDKSNNNNVPLIIIGPKIKVNVDSNAQYSQFSLLATIENLWDLPTLDKNDKSAPKIDFSR